MFIDYYIDDATNYQESEIDAMYNSLPPFRKEKVDSLKNIFDKKLSILSFAVLQKALCNRHCECLLNSITFDKYGKGHLPRKSGLFFSISHSNKKVLVVLSNVEVGCDIQYMRDINHDIASRYFSSNEILQIKENDDNKTTFYKLWTIKESYMKAVGKGMRLGLKSVDIDLSNLSLSNIEYCIYPTPDDLQEYKYSIVYKK